MRPADGRMRGLPGEGLGVLRRSCSAWAVFHHKLEGTTMKSPRQFFPNYAVITLVFVVIVVPLLMGSSDSLSESVGKDLSSRAAQLEAMEHAILGN